VSKVVEKACEMTFFTKKSKKIIKIATFADFFDDFHKFLHFSRSPSPENSIFCKFADKISKIKEFCQRQGSIPQHSSTVMPI